MGGSLNRAIVVGRIGKDPELKYINSGQPVVNFSVATDESYTKDGQKVEQTEWHRIQAWGKQAEFVGKHMGKGRLVLVEGKLQTRKWQDKQGQDRYTTEIIAQRVTAMDSKAQAGSTGGDHAAYGDLPPEDMPF